MTRETEAKSARLLLGLILFLTVAIALLWSSNRLLDQDEAFVLQTDSVGSVSKLIAVQRHNPISLDPLVYHLLGHASVTVFWPSAFAVRLPSLLGFLLMQICVFAVAKRIAGARAGLLAATIPAITATLFYAQQGRPYGLLLGLAGLLLLAYQHSTRDTDRTVWLVALAGALALALNTHYFAILLLLPLYAAELIRTAERRRPDFPVLFAILIGTGGAIFTLPFQKAAGEFRKHYYNAGTIGVHAVTQSYRALFLNYTRYTMRTQHAAMAVLVLGVLALLAALAIRFRTGEPSVPLAEKVFLGVLAILPVFGFLLARFVTHSIEVRYVLPAIIGIAVLIAIACLPLLRSGRSFVPVFVMLAGIVICTGLARIAEAHAAKLQTLASLTIPNAGAGNAPIFLQNIGNFDELGSYTADPALRSRLSLAYSAPLEIELARHDTQSLTVEHMQHFTGYRIERYEDLRSQPGPHLFIVYRGGGWNWLDRQLARDHAHITQLGPALQGELVSVTFPH